MSVITRRPVAVVTAVATAALASISLSPSGAQAADRRVVTDYGFEGRAFGSVAKAEPLGVGSSPTAPTWLGCTRKAGVNRTNFVAETGGEAGSVFHVAGVDNATRSYRDKTSVGTRSTSTIAEAVLGDPEGPHISIVGLRTKAKSFATRSNGKLHATSSATSTDISGQTGTPLDDLLNPAGATLQDLLDALSEEPGNQLEVPGLGKLQVGNSRQRVTKTRATSAASALRGVLYGQDGVSGGGDDVTFVLGKTQAVVHEGLTSGVFRGRAVPLEAGLLGNLLNIGRVNDRPLPCPGTGGKVKSSGTVDGDVGNAALIDPGVLQTRVFGVQRANRSAKAWTESRVADLVLGGGQVVLSGIVGRVNVATDRDGRITRNNIAGSTIGELVVNGEVQRPPRPGDTLEIEGLARLEFFVGKKDSRGRHVTAVRVTLLDGTEVDSVINLGHARTYIKRS